MIKTEIVTIPQNRQIWKLLLMIIQMMRKEMQIGDEVLEADVVDKETEVADKVDKEDKEEEVEAAGVVEEEEAEVNLQETHTTKEMPQLKSIHKECDI